MIDAVSMGALTIEKLEAMTCVCSVGLDMIAIGRHALQHHCRHHCGRGSHRNGEPENDCGTSDSRGGKEGGGDG